MFDLTEAYSGEMVSSTPPLNGEEATTTANTQKVPQTSEEILQHAREEAADILEKAQEQAKELVINKQIEIKASADQQIALKVNKAFTDLGEDLFSARKGIATIVEESINLIVGAIGTDKVFELSVDKATRAYINKNNLKVHAHPDSANRLRLYNISKLGDDKDPRYEIIDDPNLEQNRCLLDIGSKRIEVSLELQIEAIKKSLAKRLSQSNI